jgi:hypothetical protein
MAKDKQVIWLKKEREYFCRGDWTTQITLIRFKKTAFSRKTPFPRGQLSADSLTPVARTS